MLTIAWDVDDVLNDLMRSWFEQQWSPDHPECTLRYEDIKENPPHELLGVSSAEYLCSLDKFRLSEGFQNIPPVLEVMEWFLEHGASFRHIVVTATPLIAAPASAAWVMRHLGEWIRTFHFIPSKRQDKDIPKYDESKADFLKWLGRADVFVDDNEENLEGVEKLGMKCILIPRPWNRRKKGLNEVLEILAGLL
ncbi:MAG: hypothetical protein KGQ83_07190 [Planctomycetes bacterium]|nr:hypothetical protein [Planctomycetota bacterium]